MVSSSFNIEEFAYRLRQLISHSQDLKNENAALLLAVKNKDEEIQKLKKEIINLEEKYNVLITAKMLNITDENIEETRKRVNRLDSSATNYLFGARRNADNEVLSLNYFKYTFYVKNTGTRPASYDLIVKILDSKADTDGREVTDTLRFMIYDNDANSDAHNSIVYAKEKYHFDDNSEPQKEFVSSEQYGYAELFESDTTITTHTVRNFDAGSVRRYTLVMWLEGYDEQSSYLRDAPSNADIKLGVEINAYES